MLGAEVRSLGVCDKLFTDWTISLDESGQCLSKTGRPLVRVWWVTQKWIVGMGPVSCNSWSLMEPAIHLSLFPNLPYMHQELMKKKFNSHSEYLKLEYSFPNTEHLINSNLHECVSCPDNRHMSTESSKLINFKYSGKKCHGKSWRFFSETCHFIKLFCYSDSPASD